MVQNYTVYTGGNMRRIAPVLAFFLLVSCQAPAPPAQPQANTESTGLIEGIASGKTEIVDLGHALNSKTPYWPGPGYEPFKFEIFATIEKDHVLSGKMAFDEHTGTHLDAPNHFVTGQVSVDKLPLKQLFCPAVVIDVRQQVASNADYQLTPADITNFEQMHGRIPDNAVVFMFTGWDQRWDDYDKYKNADTKKVLHFPGFSNDAAKLLAEERNIAGIGIDTLSVDYGMSTDFMVHHISHGKGKFHLENVANLGSIPVTGAFAIVAPIKVENGTGGPARIFALVKK
jgi:kynurenine formamidase